MPRQTHFEVQVQQGGRWSIHAQFDAHQKDVAIEEAKQLDTQPGIGAVKVVREVYDSQEGTHQDYVVYKSPGLKMGEVGEVGDTGGGGGGGGGWADADDGDDGDDSYGGGFDDDDDDFDVAPAPKKRRGKPKKPSSITAILVKLLLVTLFSICLAALFTVMTSEMIGGRTLFGVRMSGNAESNMLFVVFVLTFLISAGAMVSTFLRGERLKTHSRPRRRAAPAAAPAQAAKRKGKGAPKLSQAMQGIEDYKLSDAEKAEENDETNKRLQDQLGGGEGEGGEGRGVVLDADSVPEGSEGVQSLSPHAEKQKAYMMKFMGEALESIGGDNKKLDNFNKFGVNLFLAGACETLAQTRNLEPEAHSKVLADSVRVMGFKKSHANTFADRYQEYLMQDPRYMQMFEAGRNSMNTYFQDEAAGLSHMDKALGEWNQPKPKEAASGPITVLFTDIAGSTAMTQKLGDAGAQEVVRAHNRIVRAALTDCGGKEIKHTGDGIMASFAKTTDGVDASIQMQRETMIHNQQNPDLPLHLKIGLNAGEPISEDNDLFGTTVQLSARIVDKAQADEIFVSEIVRGICAGKSYEFINRGGYAMKGFGDDMTLYEVGWRDSAAAE